MSDKLPDLLDPERVPAGRGLSFNGTLAKARCDQIASRFDFAAVHSVHYALMVKLISKDCWSLTGTVKAELVQNCVATSAPVNEVIEAQISERFVPQITSSGEDDEIDITNASTEPLIEGKLPLCEALFQFIAISADPYPRSAGAPEIHEFGPKIEKQTPFSKLIQLKK